MDHWKSWLRVPCRVEGLGFMGSLAVPFGLGSRVVRDGVCVSLFALLLALVQRHVFREV